MPNLLLRLRSIFGEMKRRKVVRVVLAYVVTAAALISFWADIAATLSLPPGAGTAVVIAALAGLPVVAILAWVYDIVPDSGATPATAPDAEAEAHPAPPERKSGAHSGGPENGPRREPLPSPATSFIGRESQLAEVTRLLEDSTSRLVTITGPGGVGKTRLAVRSAEAVAAHYDDGVVYVPLSSLTDTTLLVPALAESLGVVLSRRGEPLAELLDFLHGKQLLLVLDNFEHLTAGAALLTNIVEHAPRVQLLVTSRERLYLNQETLLALDGLSLARPGPAEPSEAARLFVAAARRLDHGFAVDAESASCAERICALVDGMPLAIELAASWVRVLSCGEIVTALERDLDILSSRAPDLPDRQKSLRATFDASWRLLDDGERDAAARIAVFRAAFDRDAAARIAGAMPPVLRQLMDKSLLTRTGGRFLMLDVVRQYALERLRDDAAAERAAFDAHLVYFGGLVHGLTDALLRSEPSAMTRIAQTIDEVRAAWNRAVATGDAAALLHMMDGLFHFYEARGWVREGEETFGRAAQALAGAEPGGGPPPPAGVDDLAAMRHAWAALEVRRGVFADRLGEHAGAEQRLRRGLNAARQLGDPREVAFALHKLGANRLAMGHYDEAEQAHREARRLAEASADRHGVGWSLTHLGNVAWARGEYDAAERDFTAALEIMRQERDRNGVWMALNNLGVIAAGQKRHDEARRRFREGLEVQEELGNQRSVAMLHHNLGSAARYAGDFVEARRHLEHGLAICRRMGYQTMLAHTLVGLAELSMREGDAVAAHETLLRALRTASAARNYPVALEALLTRARLRHQLGDDVEAARLAAFVALHPASDEDSRREAAALHAELDHGTSPVTPLSQDGGRDAAFHEAELRQVVDAVLAEEPSLRES